MATSSLSVQQLKELLYKLENTIIKTPNPYWQVKQNIPFVSSRYRIKLCEKNYILYIYSEKPPAAIIEKITTSLNNPVELPINIFPIKGYYELKEPYQFLADHASLKAKARLLQAILPE